MSAPERQRWLEVQSADLEEMLYRISHDLQAPLRRIQAFSALLGRTLEAVDDRSATFLDQLLRDAQLAQLRVQALLRLSRVGRTWQREQLESRALFEAAIARAAGRFEGSTLEVVIEGDAPLRGDRAALLDAIGELLDNARRSARQVIVLSAGGDAERWWLRIGDDGPGVPDHLVENAFQLFVSDDPPHHAGLGLTIARRVMRLHGGNAILQANSDMGAIFELWGPLDGPAD